MNAYGDARDCLVYIIESPSASDDYLGRREGDLLREMLALADIQVRYHRASSANILWFALEELKSILAQNPDRVLLLHLSAHGSSEGLLLTDGSTVTWADLKDPISAIHKAANERLILCMSSCKGFMACTLAMEESGIQPFLGVVGNSGKPTWRDTAIGFQVFYHNYAMGLGVEAAVAKMRDATGNSEFLAISASEARSAYIERLQQDVVPPAVAPPPMLPPSNATEVVPVQKVA